MQIKNDRQFTFNPYRDISAAALAVGVGAVASGGVGAALGAVGVGIRKLAVAEDSSKSRRFWCGVLAFVVGGPFGLLGYCVAAPGWSAKKDVQAARAESVAGRY